MTAFGISYTASGVVTTAEDEDTDNHENTEEDR